MKHFLFLSAALFGASYQVNAKNGVETGEPSLSVLADREHPLVADDSTSGSHTGVDAPDSGNFFYAVFHPGGTEGEYYLDFTVGSQKQNIKAWLTTSEHDTGIITTDCTTCVTDNKFNMASSSSLNEVGMPEFEDMVMFQQRQLQQNKLSGMVVNDIVTFSHDGFDFALDGRILAITGS